MDDQEHPLFTVGTLEDTPVLTKDASGYKNITIGHIRELHEYGDGECGHMSVERAERVAACWNALRDIPDPAAYVKRVERLVDAADLAQADLAVAIEFDDFGPPLGDNVKRLCDALMPLLAAAREPKPD
ncbi:hypothetical protein LCGC14_0568690 [marine sediment metagenome]|uniref:Uncharacterized protein n=1 Tax=marine sediment metagenome TaxID=412755 RepID=A0A0F9UT46_9ZZZZ|nr:hypothetical protein [Phycisphaerae bacterium]